MLFKCGRGILVFLVLTVSLFCSSAIPLPVESLYGIAVQSISAAADVEASCNSVYAGSTAIAAAIVEAEMEVEPNTSSASSETDEEDMMESDVLVGVADSVPTRRRWVSFYALPLYQRSFCTTDVHSVPRRTRSLNTLDDKNTKPFSLPPLPPLSLASCVVLAMEVARAALHRPSFSFFLGCYARDRLSTQTGYSIGG